MQTKVKFISNNDSLAVNPNFTGTLLGSALIPVVESNKNYTALEINKQIVDEVLRKKEIEKAKKPTTIFDNDDVSKLQTLIPNLEKCEFHTKKLSLKCKVCQKIKDIVKNYESNICKIDLKKEESYKENDTFESDLVQNTNTLKTSNNSFQNLNHLSFYTNPVFMSMNLNLNQNLIKLPFMMQGINSVNTTNPMIKLNQQLVNYKAINPSECEFITSADEVSNNLNPLLYNNILSCQYFKEIYSLKNTFGLICLEIVEKVKSVEPWTHGNVGIPSTMFCCLYRLMLLKLNKYQIKLLINNGEFLEEMYNPSVYSLLNIGILKMKPSIFLKAAGYLYLRYLADPLDLMNWFEQDLGNVNSYPLFLGSNKELKEGTTSFNSVEIEFGEYLDKMLRENEYYGTRFPKIPHLIEKEIISKLDEYKEYRKRKNKNIKEFNRIKKGVKVVVKVHSNSNTLVKHKWISGEILGFDEDNIDVHVKVLLESDEGNNFNINFL
jgi:hypothetical protein